MKIFFVIFIFIFSSSFAQNEEKNYFPVNEGAIWKYYFINHMNYVTAEFSNIQNDSYQLTEKIFVNNKLPFENNSNYLNSDGELKIISADSLQLPDYKPLNVPGIVLKYPLEVGKKWEFEYKGIKFKREVVKRHGELNIEDKVYQDVIEIKQTAYDANDVRTTYEYYGYNIGLLKTEALMRNNRIVILTLSDLNIKPDSSVSSEVSSGNFYGIPMITSEPNEHEFPETQSGVEIEKEEPKIEQREEPKPEEPPKTIEPTPELPATGKV